MKLLRYTLAGLVLSFSLALAGCGGDPEPEPAGVDPVTQDDLADVSDLIAEDSDAAAAAEMIGDPALFLSIARDQADKARSDVQQVFDFIKQAAAGAPIKSGARADGKAFALWQNEVGGKKIDVLLVRVEPGRFRYLVAAEATDGTKTPLLTGIFIKKGPHTGGGRFHVNLTNISDTFAMPGQGADGSLHFWFANHRADKKARRIAYVNVARRDDPTMQKVNYAGDLVRLVGVGGRFRSVGIGDYVPALPGNEIMGLKVLWKAGDGGRAAAIIGALPPNAMVLGKAQECWDKGGLRTAYLDDVPTNDAMQPNEGDVTMCSGFAQEDPGTAIDPGSANTDPEADALFQEVGADGISATDADVVDNAGI